jgi:hypothetical protein
MRPIYLIRPRSFRISLNKLLGDSRFQIHPIALSAFIAASCYCLICLLNADSSINAGLLGEYEGNLVLHASGMSMRVLCTTFVLFVVFLADYGSLTGKHFAGVHSAAIAYAAPSVTSTLPASNSTGVELNRWVRATFSEAINGSTITSATFTLQKIAPGTITANITELGPPTTTSQRVLSSTSSPFAGVYSGSYTGSFAGYFAAAISGNGEIKGIDGVASTWEYFSTTLQGSSSPWGFNAWTNMGGHFLGTVTHDLTSGTWSNGVYSGTFSGTKSLGHNTVYSASDTYSMIIADVNGASITVVLMDTQKMDYCWGSGNIDTMGNFTIPSMYSYRYNSNIASATGTINRSFAKVSGTVSYDAATNSALFKPNGNLLPNTGYRATISKTIANPDGAQMAANDVWEFTTGTTLLSNLSLAVSGSGSGSVNSNAPAPGFTCSSGACAAQFSQDSSLTLTAVPGSGSIFSGWSGACPAETGIFCTVSMNTDRNISAAFIVTPPVHILDGDYFDSLQEAFNAAGTANCTIRAKEGKLTGDLNADASSDITVAGGFDSDYTENSGFTTLDGILTIVHGSLTVENLVIK